ncbi:MAG: replication-associated recombination protein A [Planctomycetes bacterium]|nr:replication-associated recombination protein A [Planctomycetota bacterium]
MTEKPPTTPLADRMRPQSLDDFVGQDHLLGPGKLLRRAIEEDRLQSMILWGPPGSGKTTLASIIARRTKAKFVPFSAVLASIKEVKEVMAQAEDLRRLLGQRTIVFVDEIHRFNRAQQDAFLPHVEKGDILLIGATTENPSFEVNSALLSRCKVYVLNALSPDDLVGLLRRAIEGDPAMRELRLEVSDAVLRFVAESSQGDARAALGAIEFAASNAPADPDGVRRLSRAAAEDALQKSALYYDKSGEEHFNVISALHKSLRNSEPDAALYWLARMLEAGEDPLYVARRLVRFASEDVGVADPWALVVANAAKDAVEFVGMPEGKLALAEAAVYLAAAPKSNRLYVAYAAVVKDIEAGAIHPVPLHIRNAPTGLMKSLGYGKGYEYAHDVDEGVTGMSCLPAALQERRYYEPGDRGFEKTITERLATWEAIRRKMREERDAK